MRHRTRLRRRGLGRGDGTGVRKLDSTTTTTTTTTPPLQLTCSDSHITQDTSERKPFKIPQVGQSKGNRPDDDIDRSLCEEIGVEPIIEHDGKGGGEEVDVCCTDTYSG